MLSDLRLATRTLRKSPLFVLTATLTLGLTMGANVVVFSVVDQLLLRPLPFGERSARLITLHSVHPTQARDWDDSDLSVADARDIGASVQTLEAVEGWFNRNLSLAGADDSERVLGASVTVGLLDALGVQPWTGRGFRADDGAEPGFESVTLISYSLWERRFGADPSVLGTTTPINGRPLTIVGIMPPGFRFPEAHDLWLPYAARTTPPRDQRMLTTVGLMRAGASLPEVQAELDALATRLATAYPETNRDWGIRALAMRRLFVADRTSRSVAVMLGAVGLVLLVGCTNVASLLIARTLARRRELTVRAALGATRATLARLLFAESQILAALGGLLALLVAVWGLDALRTSLPEPPPFWVRLTLDTRVAGFLFVLMAVTTLACGWLPAWRATRIDLVSGLNDSSRTATSASHARAQSALLVGQVVLSLMLLVGASLLVQSARRLQDAETGFDPRPLLSLRFYIAGDAYDAPAARHDVVDRLVARVRALPGVVSAAATGVIPADDGGSGIRLVPDRGVERPSDDLGAHSIPTTPELFETLGLRPRAGRTFTAAEALDPKAGVVVINQALADRLWPGAPALDGRVGIRRPDGIDWLRIVGVVPNVVYEELGEETEQSRLAVYLPYERAGWRTMALLVRTSGDPRTLASSVRRALHDVDPGIAPYDVLTMEQRKRMTQWGERFIGQVFGAFAATALLLACLGAYGLTAQGAARRTREMGVRVVLGATRQGVLWLLLGNSLKLAGLGVAIGLPLAAAGARLVQGLLFGLSPWAPSAWVQVIVALAVSVALASYLPARRASQIDPAVSLREE
jgi:predicted permease